MGENVVVLGEPIGIQLFDDPPDRAMELLASRHRERAVGDFLGERVPECVDRLRRQPSSRRSSSMAFSSRSAASVPPPATPSRSSSRPLKSRPITDAACKAVRGPPRERSRRARRTSCTVSGTTISSSSRVRTTPDPVGRTAPVSCRERTTSSTKEDCPPPCRRSASRARPGTGSSARRARAIATLSLAERVESASRVWKATIGNRWRVAWAEREDQQDAPSGQAVGHGPQPLLGRRVRPVHVLEDDDQRPALGGADE